MKQFASVIIAKNQDGSEYLAWAGEAFKVYTDFIEAENAAKAYNLFMEENGASLRAFVSMGQLTETGWEIELASAQKIGRERFAELFPTSNYEMMVRMDMLIASHYNRPESEISAELVARHEEVKALGWDTN